MNTTKIVIREMQSNRSFQMREPFAESIREPRQSAKLHSQGQVLPFHVGCADMLNVRLSNQGYYRNPLYVRRTVPLFALVVLFVFLMNLPVVNAHREGVDLHRSLPVDEYLAKIVFDSQDAEYAS